MEAAGWNSPMKSSDVQEAFKPLPVCWLVCRKSHGGCILQRVTLCSDWAACVNNIESVTGRAPRLLSSSLLLEIKGDKKEKNEVMTEY